MCVSPRPHLGRLLQTISGLAHADVQGELRHPDVPHRVAGLLVVLHNTGAVQSAIESRYSTPYILAICPSAYRNAPLLLSGSAHTRACLFLT